MELHPDPPQRPMTGGERLFLFIFCVLLFGAFAAEMVGDFTPVKLSMILFPLFWGPLTALHEAGHALAARLCGWSVGEIVVGFGRKLWSGSIAGSQVELRAVPLTGYVTPVPPSPEPARLATAFISFAGPGIELAAVGLLALLMGFDTLTTATDHLGVVAAQTFCLAALTGVIINLIPHTGPGGSWSDGLTLVMAPFVGREYFERLALSPLLRDIEARLARGDAESALDTIEAQLERYPRVLSLHVLAAQALVALGRRGEALLRLRAAGRSLELSRADQARVEEALQQARAR